MQSSEFRTNPRFLRNEFVSKGRYGFAEVQKQNLDLSNIHLLACTDTKSKETDHYKSYGVHFFVDDYRFDGIYNNPERTIARYSQYAFLLSPDFSLYQEMPLWRQIESVSKNRWVAAYWQSQGLVVIPTISWSGARSYEFCFEAVEKNSIVAIGMIGCKHSKHSFLRGYEAMMSKIEPSTVICFGTPFKEMTGNIVAVDYVSSRKKVR